MARRQSALLTVLAIAVPILELRNSWIYQSFVGFNRISRPKQECRQKAVVQRHAADPDNILGLDEATVALHRKYHDATVEYTAMNIDWAQNKGYCNDGALTEEDKAKVVRAARQRLFRWPELTDRDSHVLEFGQKPQRFCRAVDGETLGDPKENVFVVSIPRRPSRLKHAMNELYREGVTATIVDAVDGDGFRGQDDLTRLGIVPLPGYKGHKNHDMDLTTGEVGCFMSHYTIWHHMAKNNIQSALILEDDFDFQENFVQRVGEYLEEARGVDWNIMYVGRSPPEPDLSRISEHVVEPGYTLWTVGYILRLDGAKALLDAQVEKVLAPLDDFLSLAMGRGDNLIYNDKALEWKPYIPAVLRPLAFTPPLVMPYAASLFLSDTARVRVANRFVKELPPVGSEN
eukprot:TRINITY_DN40467_c0_g1_i1.p1 TRINITY_DN40467_c0_g1~~TRINITY_DN40467_c0_g1_i1.p1  ORF type:complete len:402 (+),score=58.70 TRINITY_DN40467_c0_g1_i1:55-1260(+)